MGDILPTGAKEWEIVMMNYNQRAETNNHSKRECSSLKQAFDKMIAVKKPTADPSYPPQVRGAKKVSRKINGQASVTNIPKSDGPDNEGIEDGLKQNESDIPTDEQASSTIESNEEVGAVSVNEAVNEENEEYDSSTAVTPIGARIKRTRQYGTSEIKEVTVNLTSGLKMFFEKLGRDEPFDEVMEMNVQLDERTIVTKQAVEIQEIKGRINDIKKLMMNLRSDQRRDQN